MLHARLLLRLITLLMYWMSLSRNVHCAGANADSNEWSDAAAGAAPDSGKGVIIVLVDSVIIRVMLWLSVIDTVRCSVHSDSYATSDTASDRGAYVVTVDGKCYRVLKH